MQYKYTGEEEALLIEKWGKLAKDNNGVFKTFVDKVGGLHRFEMDILFSDGEIRFTTNEQRPLKVAFEFGSVPNFEFLIYEEDYTDKISKFFGAKEITLGDDLFDQRFFIKGEDKKAISSVLTSNMRTFLLENKISNFKLEKADSTSILELNLSYNELDYTSMESLLHRFIDCIERIKGQDLE
jgi:hypothetical protein